MWDSNTLLLKENLGVLSSILIAGHSTRGSVFGKMGLSLYLLHCEVFFFFPSHLHDHSFTCSDHSGSFYIFFPSKEIALPVAIVSMCWWEGG